VRLDRELAGALSPTPHAILMVGELLLCYPEVDERLLQHLPGREHHQGPSAVSGSECSP
jgi:hypothetical protein